jgi:hypothetical protein
MSGIWDKLTAQEQRNFAPHQLKGHKFAACVEQETKDDGKTFSRIRLLEGGTFTRDQYKAHLAKSTTPAPAAKPAAPAPPVRQPAPAESRRPMPEIEEQAEEEVEDDLPF